MRGYLKDGSLSEEAFQAQVVEVARLLGWKTYHTHDSRRSDEGFPDLVLVRGERMLVVELKSERGRVSEAQAGWLEALGEVRVVEVETWRPADWARLVAMLDHPWAIRAAKGAR